MPISPNQPEEFAEVYQYFDMDKLRLDLANVNGGDGLSPAEERCLRGVLLYKPPREIAEVCGFGGKDPGNVVSQYLKKPRQLIKMLLRMPENDSIPWNKFAFLLRDYQRFEKSYKVQSFELNGILQKFKFINQETNDYDNNRDLESIKQVEKHIVNFRNLCDLKQHIAAFYTFFNKEDYDSSLSNILDIQGQNNLLVELLEQLVKSWQPRKTEKWEFGVALASLGNAYRQINNYNKAIDCYYESLAIADEIDDYNTEAGSLLDIGLLFFLEGNSEALKYTRSGLYIARQIGNKYFESYALNNLGLILSSLGEYYKAIDYHHHSLEISRNISDYIGQASALFNLGRNHCLLGEHKKDFGEYRHALRFLQLSVEIAHQIDAFQRELDAQSELALTWYSMALSLEMLNQVSDAINSYKRAYEIFHAIGLNANAKSANDAIQRLSELSIDS